MRSLFRNFGALFLLVAFVFPSVVKMEHHHEHHICNAKNQKHLHAHHDSCQVCTFEFSVFSDNHHKIEFQNDKPIDCYLNHYHSANYYTRSKHSFQLRAPPFC